MNPPNLRDILLQDLWVHLAAMIAIGIGFASWFYSGLPAGKDPTSLELMFMIGGFAGMGLKLMNGTTAALRQAAVDASFAASRAAQAAAAAAISSAPLAPPASPVTQLPVQLVPVQPPQVASQ